VSLNATGLRRANAARVYFRAQLRLDTPPPESAAVQRALFVADGTR